MSGSKENAASSAAAIVGRLLEAENRAAEILNAAQARIQVSLAQARQQAASIIQSARQRATQTAMERMGVARLDYEQQIRRRIEKATLEAQEFEQTANAHLQEAVDAVVQWVTLGEEQP